MSPSDSPKRRPWWAVIAFLGVILLLVLVGLPLFNGTDQPPAVGETVPDFEVETFLGERVSINDLRGQVVLLNFWSSWCATCDEEALLLEQAWQVYLEAGAPVRFLGVAYMDTESESLKFLADYGITYPNGPDLGGRISSIFQVTAVPETYILDREGKLAVVKFGPFANLAEITAAVERALGQ